jgi:hypothetical protein
MKTGVIVPVCALAGSGACHTTNAYYSVTTLYYMACALLNMARRCKQRASLYPACPSPTV